MPKVKSELIDTGKVQWVFHDYPLDQIALQAAQVARYLPVDRYDPFVDALLATQDRGRSRATRITPRKCGRPPGWPA